METGVYRFEGYLFDAATGELTGPDGATRLPPKAARLLALLLARPGELVARETLRRELWPEQHVEFDQALAYTVRQVRAALGDDGAEPRFVETLPRRGYRFLGALEPDGAAVPTPARVEAPVRPRRRLVPLVAAATLALLAVAGWLQRGDQPRPAAAPAVRMALLPLGEPGLEAANDPLTDALVVALAARPGVALVGPATTAALRGSTRPHTELGRELGVDFVASGGYRPGERILFLQLVRVADGAHLFARRYRGDVAAVQGQLAGAAEAMTAAARAAP